MSSRACGSEGEDRCRSIPNASACFGMLSAMTDSFRVRPLASTSEIVAAEQPSAREHFVQHASEGPDIGAVGRQNLIANPAG
jgi:hypothetical protein